MGCRGEAAIAMVLEQRNSFITYIFSQMREERHLDVTFQTGKPVLLPPQLPIYGHLLPHMNAHPTHGLAVLTTLTLWLSSPAHLPKCPLLKETMKPKVLFPVLFLKLCCLGGRVGWEAGRRGEVACLLSHSFNLLSSPSSPHLHTHLF